MRNSYVRVPPDGAGKSIYTIEHEISGNTLQVQSMHLSDNENPEYRVRIDNKGGLYTRFTDGEPLLNAYNRQKISQEYIIGVYEHTIDSYDDLFYTYLASGGSYQFQPEYSSVKLSVDDSAGSVAERTTNRYHYYQPGVPIEVILATSCGDLGKPNNIKRWGYYDNYNGLFFQVNGNVLSIGIRSNNTGSVVDTVIEQDNWNHDKLDGTGKSGLNLDVRNSYQYFININFPSFEFKFGVYYHEQRIVCHSFESGHSSPIPTISTASLPVKFEIKNTAVTSGGSDLREIMAVVIAEKDFPNYTYWRFSDLNVVGKTVTTNTPIISFRPKIYLDNGLWNTVNSYPETLSVFTTGASVRLSIVWHGGDILTGATWSMNSIDGPLEADSGATAIDVDADDYWQTISFYVQKDVPTNIDLKPYFELNDEGILLSRGNSDNNPVQSNMTFVGTILDGTSASVTMDMTYRGLY